MVIPFEKEKQFTFSLHNWFFFGKNSSESRYVATLSYDFSELNFGTG